MRQHNRIKNEYKVDLMFKIWLLVLIIAFEYIYIQYVIPPQNGWWNYYGQELTKGKVLYKDIFCFLTPGFPYLMMFLYKIFGIHLFAYQILGLGMRCVEALLVYKAVRRIGSPVVALFTTFMGVVVTVSYLVDMPLDTNQVVRFLCVCIAYLSIKVMDAVNEKKRITSLFAMGIFTGISIVFKQTNLALFILIAIGILVIFMKRDSLKRAIKYTTVYTLSVLFVCILMVIFLLVQGNFDDCLVALSTSMGVKGGIFQSISKVFTSQLNYKEVVLAIILSLFYFIPNKMNAYVREGAIILGYFLTISRFNDYYKQSKGYSIGWDKIIFLIVAFIIFNLFVCKLSGYIKRIDLILRQKSIYKIIRGMAFVVLILLYLYFVSKQNFLHSIVKDYYVNGVFSNFIMSFVYVFFYAALFIECIQFILIITSADNRCNIGNFTFLFICILLPLIGLTSAIVQELYVLPIIAVILAMFLEINENNQKICINIIIVVLALLVIAVTVIKKETTPYSWHGWTVPELDTQQEFVYSNIAGLEGYKLTIEDEKAYEDIVDIIEENTTSEDTVYQFPNIPLFNVLTNREMGTMSAVDYWDVTPDGIAEKNAKMLKENPPKIVIWCELGDPSWNLHETLFRNGERSGQRDILTFFQEDVQNEYDKEYEYKSLSVWVRKK